MNWPLVKELAGFLGSVCIAIPWLRDFGRRRRATRTRAVRATGGLRDLQQELVAEDEGWLARAKGADLFWTIGGLTLLASSFAMGLFLTW